jgi:anti-sigma-K factor RskA
VIVSRPQAPSAPLLAALNEPGGAGRLMVTVDRGQGTIMVMPVGMAMPAEHVPELWLIPPGGVPHALGMVDAQKPMKMKIPHEMMPDIAPGAMLAVSIEPPGGSPTGKPTGPVVASGKLYLL